MTVVIQIVAAFLVAAAVQAYPTPDDNFSSSAIGSDEPFAIAHIVKASILENYYGRYGGYGGGLGGGVGYGGGQGGGRGRGYL